MSTKSTIAHQEATGDGAGWHFYEECFEPGVVYLQLEGVHIEELTTLENGVGARVVVRMPLETAQQLGLHTTVSAERWTSVARHFDDVADKNLASVEELVHTLAGEQRDGRPADAAPSDEH
ncbi:hypothetical protein GCM10027093_09430 [Paraburkholderia jirisanensis]